MQVRRICLETEVAPLVGAWIEIIKQITVVKIRIVAPLVGAWIEIELSKEKAELIASLLL